MRVSKKQTAVFVTLNIVIAALVLALVFIPEPGGSAAAKPEEDAPVSYEHNKLREPLAGSGNIKSETRLMGAGDEEVVADYFINGELYIFGNATVSGLDFDSYGGFLCRLGGRGNILGFTYFEGNITAVGLIEDGFAVAASGERNALYAVGFSGEARIAAELNGAGAAVFAIDGGVAAVTAINDNALSLTEYGYGAVFTRGKSTYISSGYKLEFFDCCVFGDRYIISARASSLPRYDSLVFYTFSAGGDAAAHYYGGSGGNALRPFGVLPYSGGFLAAVRSGGDAALVSVDYSFMSFRKDILGFAAESGRLIYDGGAYYALFDGEERRAYAIEPDLSRSRLTELDGKEVLAVIGGNVYVSGADGLTVTDKNGNRQVLEIADAHIADADGKSLLLSATGGAALSAPSGGRDVYYIILK